MLNKKSITVLAATALIAIFPLAGCNGGGVDNSEETKKMATEKDTKNPDVPPITDKGDMSMNDNPKALKGKGPG